MARFGNTVRNSGEIPVSHKLKQSGSLKSNRHSITTWKSG